MQTSPDLSATSNFDSSFVHKSFTPRLLKTLKNEYKKALKIELVAGMNRENE